MKINVLYDNFLTQDNQQKINKITIDASNDIQMSLIYKNKENQNQCVLSLRDKIGVSELSETLGKQDVREFIELLKKMYMQL